MVSFSDWVVLERSRLVTYHSESSSDFQSQGISYSF